MDGPDDGRFVRADTGGRILVGTAGTRRDVAARLRRRGGPGADRRGGAHCRVRAISPHAHPERSPDGGGDDKWRRAGYLDLD